MAVAEYKKCPKGRSEYVWIHDMKRCFNNGTCLNSTCEFKKPETDNPNRIDFQIRFTDSA